MKPYEQLTDEELDAEAERMAAKLGIDAAAVRAWLEQKRDGLDGDVAEVDLSPHED